MTLEADMCVRQNADGLYMAANLLGVKSSTGDPGRNE